MVVKEAQKDNEHETININGACCFGALRCLSEYTCLGSFCGFSAKSPNANGLWVLGRSNSVYGHR